MTTDGDNKDDDLDWGKALEDWELEREQDPGEALGENLRGGPGPRSGDASARRLYRPPDEAEAARLRAGHAGTPTPVPPSSEIDVLLADDDEVTRFAPIPRELIDSSEGSAPIRAPRNAEPPPPTVEVVHGPTDALPNFSEMDPPSGESFSGHDLHDRFIPPDAQPKPSALVATDEELDLLLAEIDRLSGAPPAMPAGEAQPQPEANTRPTAPPRPLLSAPEPAAEASPRLHAAPRPAGVRPSLDALRPRGRQPSPGEGAAPDLRGPDTTDSVELPAPGTDARLPDLTPSQPVPLPASDQRMIETLDEDAPTGMRLPPVSSLAGLDEDETTFVREHPSAAPRPAPAASGGDDDEPEIAVSTAADDELDALLSQPPPSSVPPESQAPPSRPSAPPDVRASRPAIGGAARRSRKSTDLGAEAARKVVSRRRRVEVLPLVGDGEEVLVRRVALYRKLAEASSEPPRRAALLVAAARLLEWPLRQREEAMRCYHEALAADPRQVEAIRPLRREAASAARWGEVVELCEAELAADLAPAERVEALLLLAEALWHRQGDADRSRQSVEEALTIEPGTPSALLLLAELHTASADEAGTLMALRRLANTTEDGALAAAILVDTARARELSGRVGHARELYREALERDPDAADAALGLARAARHELAPGVSSGADAGEAIDALRRAAAMLGPGMGATARYVAARWALAFGADAPTALSELLQVGTPLALALRANVLAAGETGPARAALQAWADAARGTEKAVALVALAERVAESGDLDGAENALADARAADPTLATIRVVREAILRRAGALDRLTQVADELSGPLAAAAPLARDLASRDQELEMLRRAVTDSADPLVAHVLLADASLEAGKLDGYVEALGAVAGRTLEEPAAALRLAIADQLERAGDRPGAADALGAAFEAAPSTTRIAPALARVAGEERTRVADAYRREGEVLTGARAAHALTEAGALLEAGGDSLGAAALYDEALKLAPSFVPALSARIRVARAAADGPALTRLYDLAADHTEGVASSGWRFRAALHASTTDPADGLARMRSLMDAVPGDATICDLVLRFSADLPAAERAALHELRFDHLAPTLVRAAAFRAAAAYEEAGDGATAAALYRRLLGATEEPAAIPADPTDPLAQAGLDRAELRAAQPARVAERLMRTASDERLSVEARARAFERLAALDLRERGDRASAVLALRSLLELVPDHVPTLRALERLLLDQGRFEELADVRAALASAVETADDAGSYARGAARGLLADPERPGNVIDDVVLAAFGKGASDAWIARRAAAAAAVRGDVAIHAAARERLAALLPPGAERAAEQVRAGDLRAEQGRLDEALALYRAASEGTGGTHLVALSASAELLEQTGDVQRAAETCEATARAYTVPAQSVIWWHRAGVLWQERVRDSDRAIVALTNAVHLAPTFADGYERLRALLEPRSEYKRLLELTRARIGAGGSPDTLLELHEYLASLAERIGDTGTAKDAHREALGIQPDRLDALRSLARLCAADLEWREAADALIRVARLSQDKRELRDVFFSLGDIYDGHTPDVRRAEAAFKRVLAIVPGDVPALERLAALYRRESRGADAIEAIARLCEVDTEPGRRLAHRLELAEAYERAGDLRAAEGALESARRETPTELQVVRALADFYGRQSAQTALAMHLDRAAADYRRQLEQDPEQADGYVGLAEVLSWRGRQDGARCVASAAAALGVVSPALRAMVDASGGIPGAGSAAADTELNALLAPTQLTPTVREFFRLAEELLERMLPFDVRSIPGERVSLRGHPARATIDQVARWFGFDSVDVHVIRGLSAVCFATGSSPVTLVSSADVLPVATEGELVFLLSRAYKIAQGRLSLLMRAKPDDLALAIAGVVRQYDPAYTVAGIEAPTLDDAARRAAKAMPRRIRDDLLPFALELGGARLFDAASLAAAATELADRVSLVAVGSVPAGFGALARLSGRPLTDNDPRTRLETLRAVPMLQRLLRFAVDESYFEARHRTGANRR